MITQQKFKLFSNDPKFRSVPPNNAQAQQIAIQKVYAGQKQLHRKKIIMDCIEKKTNPNIGKPDFQIDFLQSRIHAFQMQLAQDIERLYEQVEFIIDTNQQSRNIQKLVEGRVAQLSARVEEIDEMVAKRQQQQLRIVEVAVEEIEQLFMENQRLKKQNAQISARIQKKKKTIPLKKPGKSTTNFKVQKRQQ